MLKNKYTKHKVLIKKFFKEKGYTDSCSEYFGIRKDTKNDWDFKKPTEMLSDFLKWLKIQEK